MHDGACVVGGAQVADLGEVVLEEVVLHPGHDVVPVDRDEVVPAHSDHTF